MRKLLKHTVTGFIGAGILLSLTGCGKTYSDEQVQQKVLKKVHLSEKYFDNIVVKTEFSKKVDIFGQEAEVYNYQVEAKAKKDFCDGFRISFTHECRGHEYKTGEVVRKKGTVTMTPLDNMQEANK